MKRKEATFLKDEHGHLPVNRKARRWMKKKHGIMQEPVLKPVKKEGDKNNER